MVLSLCFSSVFSLEEKPGNITIKPSFFKNENNNFDIILNFDIERDWHIYWKNPGDAGIPTSFIWDLPGNISLLSEEWEIPKVFPYDDYASIGYKNSTKFKFTFHSAHDLNPNQSIRCFVSWLICKEGCYTGFDTLEIQLKSENLVESSMSFFDANEGHFPSTNQKIESIGTIINDKLTINIDNTQGIDNKHNSVIYLTENAGFLSTTQQKFVIEDNKIKLDILLDELREADPKELDGLLIITDDNQNQLAYKLSLKIK
jgi:thiol:disulfide interchange protein DsbD